ncbi:MAG: NAD(P)H-dependent glycerol-3-phosphate dehydrogenase [Actinomycetota bacterium]|nr:NAD(P)H-dependent glycerol-3-phosphate dehydrogenase [Actinomycetota bacterium]
MKISVIGAGSWGTAIAAHLSRRGHDVRLWAREKEVAEGINQQRRNPLYLKDIELPPHIAAEGDMARSLEGAETVVLAVPSRWTREVAREMQECLPEKAPLINLAKGFDYTTGKRLSVSIGEETSRKDAGLAVLSGPNHAEEVIRMVPSATVIASPDRELSSRLQEAFSSPYFRVYSNADMIGVEVGGAYKNVIAIAAGMLDGLGLGDNTKASLITRGLAEMARFGSAMGANPITFSGLSGVGDLMVTCISRHSRNRGFGKRLGEGGRPEEILRETKMVVEGVYTTRSVIRTALEMEVDIPIARGVYAVLEEEARPDEMAERLMTRSLKEETEEDLYRDFLLADSRRRSTE